MEQRVLHTFEMLDGSYELECWEIGNGDPVCLLIAGIHGDEYLSMEIAEHVSDNLEPATGTVRIIPVANIFAAFRRARATPWPEFDSHESEERNLNRSFDAAKAADDPRELSLTAAVAYYILNEVETADYVIDMHTASWPDRKLPHGRIKVSESYDSDVVDAMEDLLQWSGLEHALKTDPAEIGSGVLSDIVPQLGTPAITLEIGGAGNYREEDWETYRTVIRNLLQGVGIKEGESVIGEPSIFHGLRTVYAPRSGTLEHVKELGDSVTKGDMIARVRDTTGKIIDTVEAPVAGVIEAVTQRDAVNRGNRVAKIAIE